MSLEQKPKTRTKSKAFFENSKRGTHVIRLPFSLEEYSRHFEKPEEFRQLIDAMFVWYPELFPAGMSAGYKLHDKRMSTKMGIPYRRIKVHGEAEPYSIVPREVMPYFTGTVEDSFFPLLLLRYGVPPEVLAMGFGKNAMHYYRQFLHLGHFELVGTTIKHEDKLPLHYAADEKITFWNGQEVYACMTAAQGCILGMALSTSEDEAGLGRAYGVFRKEAQRLSPGFAPLSVLTDGWLATRKAWKSLFSSIVLVLCFLHAFLKIREVGKRDKEAYATLSDKIWEAYRQEDRERFSTAMLEIGQWAKQNVTNATLLERVEKICARTAEYACSYDTPQALRTSNTVDRPMDAFDRFIYGNKYYHGHLSSAECGARAFALCYNFAPYCQRTSKDPKNQHLQSRAADLNGFVYSDCWLQNLLVAASMNGTRGRHQKS